MPKAVGLILCALVALTAGIWLGGHPEHLPGSVREALVDDDRATRAEVIDSIEDNFYKPVKEQEFEDASLKGIVRSLNDPFSTYVTPKEAKEFNASLEGEFEGVGMNVEEDRRGLKVLQVFEKTPAERGGVKNGDFILAVNGRSLAGVSSDVATARIRGPAGTPVELRVFSPGDDAPRTVKLQRERIEAPVARGRVVERDGHKIAVAELYGFTPGAHGALRSEIQAALRKGAEGIVLDLRGNPGGRLTEAILVSSIFIEDGEIVSVRGRHRAERTHEAEGDAIDQDIPVVVLVNGGSASASEIVTGALRDRHRGTVVGTRTFGKGLVQELIPLSNGGVLDLTVANYYLPGGKTISTRGIKPDVRARDNPDTDRDEALPKALDTLAGELR
jgi:carboxyl-terminal processing protease